jgi:hypothetical protein
MSSVSVTQSTINWHVVKQIDRQGVKSLPPPEPHLDSLFEERVREFSSQLLVEMENLYQHSLAQIEERVQTSIQVFNQKIIMLE